VGTTKPPLELPRAEYRPVIIDQNDQITDEGVAWLNEILNLYVRNCMVLSTMRGEATKQCKRGLERPPSN
jgi:hypothetical protein